MACLRSCTRLATLSRMSRSVFGSGGCTLLAPALAGLPAAGALRATPAVVRAFAAAAELAKEPLMDNKMFCYQASRVVWGPGRAGLGMHGGGRQ